MHAPRSARSAAALLLMALVAVLAGASPAAAERAERPASTAAAEAGTYPSSISALGDSITRGFNAAGWFSDWPSRSWSTGTYSTVDSHYARLRALNPAIRGQAYNDARTGAKMGALATQATTSVSQGAEYVTVLMGANDACTETEEQMTTVSALRTRFTNGMEVLAGQQPQPQVLVASIPDLRRLWQVGKNSSSARSAWSAYGICQSMLARPLSTDQADVDRRARVRQRVVDYNTALAEVCATYTFCRYDGGAVFGYPFALSQLSGWDYFHPNTAGQAVLADVTWQAGFWAAADQAASTAR
jgi:lysophospholipase L1-like esterase